MRKNRELKERRKSTETTNEFLIKKSECFLLIYIIVYILKKKNIFTKYLKF